MTDVPWTWMEESPLARHLARGPHPHDDLGWEARMAARPPLAVPDPERLLWLDDAAIRRRRPLATQHLPPGHAIDSMGVPLAHYYHRLGGDGLIYANIHTTQEPTMTDTFSVSTSTIGREPRVRMPNGQFATAPKPTDTRDPNVRVWTDAEKDARPPSGVFADLPRLEGVKADNGSEWHPEWAGRWSGYGGRYPDAEQTRAVANLDCGSALWISRDGGIHISSESNSRRDNMPVDRAARWSYGVLQAVELSRRLVGLPSVAGSPEGMEKALRDLFAATDRYRDTVGRQLLLEARRQLDGYAAYRTAHPEGNVGGLTEAELSTIREEAVEAWRRDNDDDFEVD